MGRRVKGRGDVCTGRGILCRWGVDGRLEYLGRRDHQVKVRGYRVELGEIERVLEEHPHVRRGVVTGGRGGTEERRLTAYVEWESGEGENGAKLETSELRDYLRARLPEYMVPAVYVKLEEIPLSPSGKVNRKALPAPERVRPESLDSYVGARTAEEEKLVRVWQEVLGVEPVGVHDNFFELGGDSILSIQVVSRARGEGIHLTPQQIFRHQTIAELATSISEASAHPEPIRPVPRRGDMPLSFAQQRLWFLEQLMPGLAAYNMPLAVRVRGSIDIRALRRSLAEVVRRHESLRTIFATENGRAVQRVISSLPVPLPVVDLTMMPRVEKRDLTHRMVAAEAQRPFDLAEGPLIRAYLLRLEDREHAAIFTMHHIISDGWSMGVLVREMATLYVAFSSGRPSPLPELPVQYADFAQWQREWLTGEALEHQLSYWKRQLAHLPALQLPTDRPRPAVQTHHGALHSRKLPLELSNALKELSQRERATLFTTLLAGFAALLFRYTGQEDVVVGVPVANRSPETEGMIGFFVNSLVLRTDLSGAPGFLELLRRVRETAREAFEHQDIPFDKLVDELQPKRDLSRMPFFQVMFNFLGLAGNRGEDRLEFHGVSFESLVASEVESKFDLTLFAREQGDGIGLMFSYNADLFDSATIEKMAEHYLALLEDAMKNPGESVARLRIQREDAREDLLEAFSGELDDF